MTADPLPDPTVTSDEEARALATELLAYDEEDLLAMVESLPESLAQTLADSLNNLISPKLATIPKGPIEQARDVDEGYRSRAHLRYLSRRLVHAVHQVEQGTSRRLIVSMPPRMGKSQLVSVYFPLWLLRTHPDWSLGMISHSDTLATGWGRDIRSILEEQAPRYGRILMKDGGAASRWTTTQQGSFTARSAPGQSITGLGFRCLIMDDVVRDFASAHSSKARENLWDWWRANAYTRLEPPSLVIAIGTRWHEDDLLGRLIDPDRSEDAHEWERITFPAIASEDDVLGRAPGDPLLSPLIADETKEEALERWEGIRAAVGTYTWSALYQQRPSPAQGAIFNTGWWRYWTRDPEKVTDDGTVVLLPEEIERGRGKWVDSWDAAFKDTTDSDFVVGQRWCRLGADRFLIDQQRGRWSFTQTIERMRDWSRDNPAVPLNRFVHRHLIEDRANGPAIISSLKHEIAGIIPVNPTNSKEARARAVTPEVESGNVYLPHPTEPGFGWVSADYLPEFRDFPAGAHDDQVDASSQALSDLRDPGRSRATVPRGAGSGARRSSVRSLGSRSVTHSATTERRRTG